MAMVEQNQVWVGSEDSVIYIISTHSMSCNKQLTDHRASVTGLVVQDGPEAPRYAGPPGSGCPQGQVWRVRSGMGVGWRPRLLLVWGQRSAPSCGDSCRLFLGPRAALRRPLT